jgi:hypothetical protein
MVHMPSILRLMRNHINTFILRDQQIRTNYGGGKVKDQLEFTITYKNYKYTFQKLDKTADMLFLYSYDKLNNDCVMLSIDKDKKQINLTSFGNRSGCFREEANIGSNLLKITLKMCEDLLENTKYFLIKSIVSLETKKYKNKLGVNEIVLSDNSNYVCKTNKKTKNINFAKMHILLSGQTWYEKYGFKPYTENFEFDNKLYNKSLKNIDIMNKIKVKDINMKNYLKKINEQYPNEFTKETINDLLNISQNKLIKDFLSELFEKGSFNLTCKYLAVIFKDLFTELKLEVPSHYYGKELNEKS